MAVINIKNIEKIFPNKKKALNKINLSVEAGEFIVLLGPSGCGKTTLLRIISGLEEASQGELWLKGRLANQIPPQKRDLAMVFQNYALYPHMSVYDNIAFGLKIKKIDKQTIHDRVHKIAKRLEIEHYLKNKPKDLSGGERQRVALARAISRYPHFILFDEPLSNLDAKLRVSMRNYIAQLHKEIGTTIIYVTHDQTEAMALGDRICVINKGQIMQLGTPQELYHHPQSLFVAGFIGTPSMNFIPLHVKGIDLYMGKEKLPIHLKENKDSIDSLVLGVRPENMYISSTPNQEKFYFPAQIFYIENMGFEQYIHIKHSLFLNEKQEQTNLGIIRDTQFTLDPTQENIPCSFHWNKLHLFHPRTGQTLIYDLE